MNERMKQIAIEWLRTNYDRLSERDQRVIQHIADRKHISRNTNIEFSDQLTFGQRLADRVASSGGSWSFILLFCAVLVSWVVINTFILARYHEAFDSYPYILLNLVLSMLAALQAPIIMMSQNRQSARDRLEATHDYEVNLKAELEILGLHEKLDALRERQWEELVRLQHEQLRLLTQLLNERSKGER